MILAARSRSPGRSSRRCPRRTPACTANETIGRGSERAEVSELLMRPGVRLVTLLGPGGVGKTRLALEVGRAVAERFPGGVGHLNLDGVKDAGVLVPGAAAALGVVAATAGELGEQLARATPGSGAAGPGRHRALPRRRQAGGGTAHRGSQPVGVGDQPCRPAAERRAHLSRPAIDPTQRRGVAGRACQCGPRGLGGRRRDRRRDLRPPGRPAAGDRVGGGPGRMLPPGRCSRASSAGSSCSPVGATSRRASGRSGRRSSGRGTRRAARAGAARQADGVRGRRLAGGDRGRSATASLSGAWNRSCHRCSTRRRCCRRTPARMRSPGFRCWTRCGSCGRTGRQPPRRRHDRAPARSVLPGVLRAGSRGGARTDRRGARTARAGAAQHPPGVRAVAARRRRRRGAPGGHCVRARLPWDAHVHEVRGWLAQALAAATPAPAPPRQRPLLGRTASLSQARLDDARSSSRRRWPWHGRPANQPSRRRRSPAWGAGRLWSRLPRPPTSVTRRWPRPVAPAIPYWSPTRCSSWPGHVSGPGCGSAPDSSPGRRCRSTARG